MNKTVTIVVKDQYDAEFEALAVIDNLEDIETSLFKKVQQIQVDGDVIFPNMDLVFENPKDGKIYKVVKVL